MADDFPLRKIDHMKFFVGNARQAAYFYRNAFGFDIMAYSGLETGVKHEASYVLKQGQIIFVLTSPLTPDHVNPEAPWPEIERLAAQTEAAGKLLVERLAIYPSHLQEGGRWLSPPMLKAALIHADAEGFSRPDAWVAGDGLALRRAVAQDLQSLQRGQAAPAELAQRWVADGRAEERLRHLAELALREASGLTDPARTRTLAARFDAANRTRELLRSTVRADLAVTETLLQWVSGHA